MLITKKLACCIALAFSTLSINAQSITIEEQRIDKASKIMPEISSALSDRVNLFVEQINKARNLTVLSQLSIRHGKGIWTDAKLYFKNTNNFDDRPLYWARLKMSKALKQTKAFKESLPDQQKKLLWQFELYSRGQTDVKFDKDTSKKILITGFDPFLLDRNIKQSNPSGISAIVLDDLVVSSEGKSAEIETLILPVRFEDFDQGMVEELLTPYFRNNAVDMIITVSMGRNSFELERFSGLRRSALVPDNSNIITGASKDSPLVPMLGESLLKGPEFLEFTLPVEEIKTASGFFPIKDNRIVTTKNEILRVTALSELINEISVEGSGGGYLSNEIAYRSLLLRDLFNPVLPVGHIHTPSIRGYDEEKIKLILSQLKAMLTQAAKTL
jgi:pyrrolidone-carboxylate peptidase